MSEKQNIEYKQSWRDEYQKWVCGFANAQGGKIYIGIDDKGNVVGVSDAKKLMEDIPNKIMSNLGMMADVNLLEKDSKEYLEIVVPVSAMPISYHGIYHYRTGSTKQELKGTALNEFLLKKMGTTWDNMPVGYASLNDIDEMAVKTFVAKAIKSGRLIEGAEDEPIDSLFEKLDLIAADGKLKAAAILLFGKNPKKFFGSSYFKIGRFGSSDDDLKFHDVVEGNVFEMVERVMKLLRERYLISPISYEGIQRVEKLEYPEDALREMILNAIVHKDYTGESIQFSIYDDRILLWNSGGLTEGLTIETLKSKHPSKARNRNIADIFFKAGYIETWGRGIQKMTSALKDVGYPEPIFEELAGGFQVTFKKEKFTLSELKHLGLRPRQIDLYKSIKENGEASSAEYQKTAEIGKTVASEDLQELVDKGVLTIKGKGPATRYILAT